MGFSRKKYEKKLKIRYMKNPGKRNKEDRKNYLNSQRGTQAPPSKVIPDKRREAKA